MLFWGRIMKFGIAIGIMFLATAAQAQSVTSRVTGAVGGATASVSSTAGVGGVSASGGSPDFSALNTSSGGGAVGMGGDWNGGARTRVGGKDVTIRGAVASEGGSSAFKAGAGIGF